MGRLMLSLLLNEQINSNASDNTGGRSETGSGNGSSAIEDENENENGPTVPKWSASNAFDPDSEEFWSGDDVVYEAFVDPNDPMSMPEEALREMERRYRRSDSSRLPPLTTDSDDGMEEERREEEEALIASGNESQRRRRREVNNYDSPMQGQQPQDPWVSMANLLTSEPQDMVRTSAVRHLDSNSNNHVRIIGESGEPFEIREVQMAHHPRARTTGTDNNNNTPTPQDTVVREPWGIRDPSLTTRGLRTLHPNASLRGSSRFVSPSASQTPNIAVEMITDAQRTTSPAPMSYVTYGDVQIFIPRNASQSQQPQVRVRRRESQPPPPSISLMG